MADITSLTAYDIAEGVRARKFSAVDVSKAFLARAQALNPTLNAFLVILEKECLAQAEQVDRDVAAGKKMRLAGVPVAVKDNINIKGAPTTCSSKILEGYIAPYDATVITHLRAEGAVFIGKTNLDEFAMGSSTDNSAFGVTRNPWALDRVPGGSSGGSAAAVAARLAPVALGSDTGGSIRQPAALCGIVGLKPTYGRVSRYGLVAFASSLDQIGPLTTDVRDAALVQSVIEGHDPRDSTSAKFQAQDLLGGFEDSIKGLKVGIPKECFMEGLDPEVEQATRRALESLKELGVETREVSLPTMSSGLSVYYLVAPSEASANLARFDGVRYGHSAGRAPLPTGEGGRRPGEGTSLLDLYERSRGEGFGPEVKRRIMLGTYALSAGYYEAYYGKAQRVRTLIRRDFDKAFAEVDLLLTPTTPTPAFKIGEKVSDPLQMYLNDVFTIPCNLAGVSGISLPAGLSKSGLPIGVQLMGRNFEEGILLRASRALEKSGMRIQQVPNPLPLGEDARRAGEGK